MSDVTAKRPSAVNSVQDNRTDGGRGLLNSVLLGQKLAAHRAPFRELSSGRSSSEESVQSSLRPPLALCSAVTHSPGPIVTRDPAARIRTCRL